MSALLIFFPFGRFGFPFLSVNGLFLSLIGVTVDGGLPITSAVEFPPPNPPPPPAFTAVRERERCGRRRERGKGRAIEKQYNIQVCGINWKYGNGRMEVWNGIMEVWEWENGQHILLLALFFSTLSLIFVSTAFPKCSASCSSAKLSPTINFCSEHDNDKGCSQM